LNKQVQDSKIRPQVLMVNANSSGTVTSHLTAMAEASAPHLDFIPLTPSFGPPYILNPADVAVAAHAVLDVVTNYCETATRQPDACIVACFGDVGLSALRHRFAFPVVNMAEAGILTALQLGVRYGIIALGRYWPSMLHEMVRLYGLEARYAGVYRIQGEPLELLNDPAAARAALQAVISTIPPGSVDVLIMGGAALTGIARHVQSSVPFPLVDCLYAAVSQIDAAMLYHRLAKTYQAA
jgi:Asp/Glu/hydantoin racemase